MTVKVLKRQVVDAYTLFPIQVPIPNSNKIKLLLTGSAIKVNPRTGIGWYDGFEFRIERGQYSIVI